MPGFQKSQQSQQTQQQTQKTQKTQQTQQTQQTTSSKKSGSKKDYADMTSIEIRDEINRLKRSYDGLKKSIDGLEAMEGSVVSTADLQRQSKELVSKMNELAKLYNQQVEEEKQAAAAKKAAEATVSAGGGKYVVNIYVGDGNTPRTDCNAQP